MVKNNINSWTQPISSNRRRLIVFRRVVLLQLVTLVARLGAELAHSLMEHFMGAQQADVLVGAEVVHITKAHRTVKK
jgi:hypothetical protein